MNGLPGLIWFWPLPANVAGFNILAGSILDTPMFRANAVTLGTAPVDEEPLWSNIIFIDASLLLLNDPRNAVTAGISVEAAGGVDDPKERTVGVAVTDACVDTLMDLPG